MTVKPCEVYKTARCHLASFLSPVAVARYLPMVEQITQDHLASCWQPPKGRAEGDDFELLAYDLMKNLTFRMIASLCLSLGPGSELDELNRQATVFGKGPMQPGIKIPGFPYHSALKARAGIIDLLEKLMARRRAELEKGTATGTQDVLSYLMTQPDENGRMSTDGEVKDNILLFLFAGHDTSSSALTMTLIYVAKNPSICQRMREEHDAIASSKAREDGYKLTQEDVRAMKYTWAVVQEIMRLQPPVAGAFREAIEDFEFNGYTILKGWKVFWTNQSTHQNPKFFENPKEFDPSRFFEADKSDLVPFTYLPFGGGARLCPGNEFAKMEMLVFLHYLTRNYVWTLCEPDEPIVRKQFPRQANGTPIKVKKRNKSLDLDQ